MKKIEFKRTIFFLVMIFMIQSTYLNAQSLIGGNNIIKTSLTDLPFNNYSITYERALGRLFSISFSYKFSPEQKIPILSNLSNLVNYSPDNDINIFNLSYSSHTTQLQGRFYIGLGKMKGFYVAPYFRYANFNIQQPVNFKYDISVPDAAPISLDTNDLVSGQADAYTFGAAIGYQWQILNKIVIDFSIIGGGYGQINANFESRNTYPTNTDGLQSLFNELNQKLSNLNGYTVKNEIDNNTSKVNTRIAGPWYSLVVLNLSVGIRF